MFPVTGNGKRVEGAPITPVTVTVCHSENGELEAGVAVPVGKGLGFSCSSSKQGILAVSLFSLFA